MKKIKSFAAFCLLYNLNPFDVVKADQPVHCLRENMYGIWNFHTSKVQENVNLFEINEVCSHSLPNKV